MATKPRAECRASSACVPSPGQRPPRVSCLKGLLPAAGTGCLRTCSRAFCTCCTKSSCRPPVRTACAVPWQKGRSPPLPSRPWVHVLLAILGPRENLHWRAGEDDRPPLTALTTSVACLLNSDTVGSNMCARPRVQPCHPRERKAWGEHTPRCDPHCCQPRCTRRRCGRGGARPCVQDASSSCRRSTCRRARPAVGSSGRSERPSRIGWRHPHGSPPRVGGRGRLFAEGVTPPRPARLSLVAGAAGGSATSRSTASSTASSSTPPSSRCAAPKGAPWDPTPWPSHARGELPWPRSLSAHRSRAPSAPAARSASPRARPCSRPAVLRTSYARRSSLC